MKLHSKRAAGILKSGGKLTQPSWGDAQYLKLSDTDKFQHYLLRGDKILFENYSLTYVDIFLVEWETQK